MQKSEGADNQHGQALSYLTGVYFGDGCIDTAWRNQDGTERRRFRLRVIDEDFVNYTADAIKIAWGVEARMGLDSSERYGSKPLHMLTVCDENVARLEQDCGKRTLIPNYIYSSDANKRAFIEGVLDSEGWVAMHWQEYGRFYLQVGFGMTSEKMFDMVNICRGLGLQTGKVQTKHYPSGKIMKITLFNVGSFLDSKLQFHCWRKQRKIEAYKAARKALEECMGPFPSGVSFNDYKRAFRERVCNSLRMME